MRANALPTLGSAAAAVLMTTVSGAQAPPQQAAPVASCQTSMSTARAHRQQGELIAARHELNGCQGCGASDAEACAELDRDIHASTPSIVVAVQDAAGNDIVAVRLIIDGKLIMVALDGRGLPVDPGLHVLRLERDGAAPIDKQIVAREAEKNRIIRIQLAAPTAALPPPAVASYRPAQYPPAQAPPPQLSRSQTSPLVYAGFAVGGAGLLLGTITGLVSMSQFSDLEQQCTSTGCTQEEIDSGETLAHVSTIGFVAAGVGAVIGVVGLMLSGPGEPSEQAVGQVTTRIGLGGARLDVRF